MRFLIMLFLTFALVFGTVAQLDVPAVSTEDGATLITLSVEIKPGDGDVYVSVAPLAGEEFQQSILSAIGYAKSQRNLSGVDFFIKSNAAEKAFLLDGPSAGAAMAIIALSLADGKPLNKNITITGGVLADGSIISVGGIPQKADVAAAVGKKVILIPKSSLDDLAMLERISLETGIQPVQYSSVAEAYEIFTEDENVSIAKNIQYPSLEYTSAAHLPQAKQNTKFSPAVQDMISTLLVEVEYLNTTYPSAYKYFKAKADLAKSLFERGYTYSAGNEAFLALTKMYVLKADISDSNLALLRENTNNCLQRVEKNLHNFKGSAYDYANAELRYYWARRAIDEVELHPKTLSDRLEAAYTLRQAQLWCAIAENLSDGEKGGVPLNVSAFKKVDEELLRIYFTSGGDHFAKGVDAYTRGYYGASLLELSIHASEVNNSGISYTTNTSFSEWGEMMLSHADYLESNPEYGKSSAEGIRRFVLFASIHLDRVEQFHKQYETSKPVQTIVVGESSKAHEVCVCEREYDFVLFTLLMLLCILILGVIVYNLCYKKGGRQKWKTKTNLQQ